MNVTIQAKKLNSSVAVIFLLFLLGGCGNGAGQVGVMTKCRQAEVTVDAAQKEYDQAILELSKKPNDERLKKAVPDKAKSLLETEEKAYQICNRLK
jgi:hypothetical protein